MNFYSVYNLNTYSEIPLPGFPHGKQEKSIDITIQYGEVGHRIETPKIEAVCFQASPEHILILLPDIARILVTNGKTVTVEPLSNNKNGAIQLFLINHVLSIIQHQQKKLVLHASVVRNSKKALAIAGETGSGKSTLSAALCLHSEYHLVADEHCVLDFHSQLGLQALLGSPFIQVWEECLPYLGKNIDQLNPIRQGLKKYFLPIDQPQNCTSRAISLHECYILKWCTESKASIRQLHGQEKLTALLQQVYQWPYVKGMELQQHVFLKCTQLAKQINVFEFQRPKSLSTLEATLDVLSNTTTQTADYDNRTTLNA